MTYSPQNMSFAELDVAIREVSAEAPEGGATGPGGEADLTASSMAPTLEVAMAVIDTISDILSPATNAPQQPQQTSSFFAPATARASKASSFMTPSPVVARQSEIMPMSYGQRRAAANELRNSRFVSGRVMAGALQQGKGGPARDIFGNDLPERIRIQDMSMGRGAPRIKGLRSQPKKAVLSPEDAMQMGLPQAASQLAALLRARNEPSLKTIELSMDNDQRGMRAALQSAPQLQQQLKMEPPAPKAPAPATVSR